MFHNSLLGEIEKWFFLIFSLIGRLHISYLHFWVEFPGSSGESLGKQALSGPRAASLQAWRHLLISQNCPLGAHLIMRGGAARVLKTTGKPWAFALGLFPLAYWQAKYLSQVFITIPKISYWWRQEVSFGSQFWRFTVQGQVGSILPSTKAEIGVGIGFVEK